MRTDNEKVVRCSFLISRRIAQNMKPYSDGNFVKQCLTDVAEQMCPKMVQEYEKSSLSRWTIARRIDELAGDICDTLKDKTLFHGVLQSMIARMGRTRYSWLYLYKEWTRR